MLLKDIDQNYQFLLSEISKQMSSVGKQLQHQDSRHLKRVEAREDYIDILKNIIENKCFSRLITTDQKNKNAANITRAVHTIAVNLERIGDFCVNIMRQFQFFDNPNFMTDRYDTKPFVGEIQKALKVTNDALFNADLSLALKICRAEFKTDKLYKDHFIKIIKDIKDKNQSTEIQNLITALFIFRYLERIGDSLLNIGEAIISSILGEKLKIHQYEALEEGLIQTNNGSLHSEVGFASMGETRSGCRIGLVQSKDLDTKGRGVIFKDGKLDKIRKEKEGIEKWKAVDPGLPPNIYDYREHDKDASILLECLPGSTFQEILINERPAVIIGILEKICRSCQRVWEKTLKAEPIAPGFIEQLMVRLDDVYHIHPEINNEDQFIGKSLYPSLVNMLGSAQELEKEMSAPFSVLIHGDFNVDNIIMNQADDRINFIDLHRSADKDYLQDVSVFLVSIFRLPAISNSKRPFINDVLNEFFRFCQQFASQNNDINFEARLALGLVRSFISSTRFQLNSKIAMEMFQRGGYLLKKIIEHDPEHLHEFHIPSFAISF